MLKLTVRCNLGILGIVRYLNLLNFIVNVGVNAVKMFRFRSVYGHVCYDSIISNDHCVLL